MEVVAARAAAVAVLAPGRVAVAPLLPPLSSCTVCRFCPRARASKGETPSCSAYATSTSCFGEEEEEEEKQRACE